MAELQLSIVANEVVINVLGAVHEKAVLVRENTNLDLGSTAGADGAGVERKAVVILRVIDHLAFQELGGINVSIIFHVLNLLALIVACAAVNVVVLLELAFAVVFSFLLLLFLSLLVCVLALLASVTHFLLVVLEVLDSRLEVSLKVNEVLSVVVVAGCAVVVGTKTEENKALGGKDSPRVLIVSELVVVGLDELALFELDRVLGNVDFVFILLFEATCE
jgi:hypothetical protein